MRFLEIEAKYTASEAQFADILKITKLGEYKLQEMEEQVLTDHYMDTSEGDIRNGGYACRLREKHGQLILTVKGMGSAEGSIHKREEYEAKIQKETSPEQWPDSPARSLILSLIHSKPLSELCAIHQRRTKRAVYHNQRRVGEMSLDVVDMQVGVQLRRCYEIEMELQQDGTLQDLKILDTILAGYGLRPEPLSKFERALIQIEKSSGNSGA